MRITEFATQLFQKFVPVSTEAVSTLNVQLSNEYQKLLNSMETKQKEASDLQSKIDKIAVEANTFPAGSDEQNAKLAEADKIIFQLDNLEKPTVLERVVGYLDKPLVRVLLLISFAFVARWLTKKLMSAPKVDEPEDDTVEPSAPNGAQQQYYPPFPPQGYYQQPYYHQQPYQGQPRR